MKLWESSHSFKHPWNTITLSNWNKYPNPISTHVISCDVISRKIENGVLITERLLSCKQGVPSILKSLGLGFEEIAYFHEISSLNFETQEYRAQTVNLTMRSLLNVDETCILKPDPSCPKSTIFTQQALVTANLAAVGRIIEEVAVSRFKANATKGKEALESVANRIWNEVKEIEFNLGKL